MAPTVMPRAKSKSNIIVTKLLTIFYPHSRVTKRLVLKYVFFFVNFQKKVVDMYRFY